MIGKILDLKPNYVVFSIPREQQEFLASLVDKELDVEVKPHRNKRSSEANRYAWVLMGQLALAQGISNIEVYRNYIKDYGIYTIVPVAEKAANMLTQSWTEKGVGWLCDRMPSKLKGYVNIQLFYGSSSYDSKQMARLIDNIVEDCKLYNIEVRSEAEIKSMKEAWK